MPFTKASRASGNKPRIRIRTSFTRGHSVAISAVARSFVASAVTATLRRILRGIRTTSSSKFQLMIYYSHASPNSYVLKPCKSFIRYSENSCELALYEYRENQSQELSPLVFNNLLELTAFKLDTPRDNKGSREKSSSLWRRHSCLRSCQRSKKKMSSQRRI